MKTSLFLAVFLLANSFPAFGTGTVHFSNRVLAAGLDAPFYAADGTTRLAGEAYLAQLYAGRNADLLRPAGPPVTFRTGTGAGYFEPGVSNVREIPDVPAGEAACVRICFWQAAAGRTFEEAQAAWGYVGQSAVLVVLPGGAGEPPSVPANLVGLQSASLIEPVIPGGRHATVRFSNHIPSARIEAPVFHVDGFSRLAGAGFRAQLYAGTSATSLLPVGAPVPFQNGPEAGYWAGADQDVLILAAFQPGQDAVVAVRAWAAGGGASYEEALAQQALVGSSEAISIRTGGAGVPPASPAILAGLRSFQLTAPAVVANGPGTINVNNRMFAAGLDAPVFHLDGSTRLDSAYRAQLYAGTTAYDLIPVGESFSFRDGAGAGYLNVGTGAERALPHVAAGAVAFAQIRAWDPAFGMIWEAALAADGPVGTSAVITVETGGAGWPPSVPANLVGLQSFSLVGPPLFLLQPAGGTYFAGRTLVLHTELMTGEPVTLQWQRDGWDLPGETARELDFGRLQPSQSGAYRLRASHAGRTSFSAIAPVTVLPLPAGAAVLFVNRWPEVALDAPVLDANGGKPLGHAGFVAQLYAGQTADALVPVGDPAPFGTASDAGYWLPGATPWRVLPGMAPGDQALVQVRVWNGSRFTSYEAAVAAADSVGVSEILEITTGGGSEVPTVLTGLRPFGLGLAPRIVRTASGDRLLQLGQDLMLEAEATGAAPIQYRWFFNGQALPDANAASLNLGQVELADAGEYWVEAGNRFGKSAGPRLRVVITEATSGGTFRFSNQAPGVNRPVLEVDNLGRNVRLSGTDYRVELLVGPTPETLQPLGEPGRFSNDPKLAGYWEAAPLDRIAGNVAPGVEAFCQVRAWNSAAGATYAEARANGGSNGQTGVFRTVAGGSGTPVSPAASLAAMPSLVLRQPPTLVWPTGDLLVEVGKTFWIDVGVQGSYTAMITLTWEFQRAGQSDWTIVPGAARSRLYYPAASKNHEGAYRVVAESAAGRTVSSPLLLYVAERIFVGDPGWQNLRLELAEAVDGACRIEASTNFVNWQPLYQTNNPGTAIAFSDPQAAKLSQRFYRARNIATGKVASTAAVGFVQLAIPYGYALRSNPLRTGDDTVGSILAGLPETIMIYQYDPATGYTVNSLLEGSWDRPAESLAPGEAFVTRSTAIDTHVINIVGQVPEGSHARLLPRGWSLLASPGPLAGRIDTVLQIPVHRDDNVDLLNRRTYGFDAFVYDGKGGWYSGDPLQLGPAPTVAVGEAFWFYTEEAKTWTLEYASNR